MNRNYNYKELYLFFLSVYFVSLPLGALALGAFGSLLRYIAIIPLGLAILGSKKVRVSSPLLLYGAFVLIGFLTMIWSINVDDSLSYIIGQVMLFALMISGGMFTYTKGEVEKLKSALAWGSRFSALAALMFGDFVRGRLWLTDTIIENPNYFCTYFIFGIILALEHLIGQKKLKTKIFSLLELIVYIVLIFLSGSRGGLLSASVGIFAYIIFSGNRGLRPLMIKIFTSAIIIVIAVFVISKLPENLQLRFTVDSVVESGGTGRTDIWANAFNVFKNSSLLRKFFGYGFGTIGDAFRLFGYPGVDSHNAMIGNLITTGAVGLVFYALAIFAFIFKAVRFKNKFAFSIMLAIFVFTFGASAVALKSYFNIMLFIIISLNTVTTEKEEVNISK